jgi:RND superfamily putative drug exporter
MLGLVGRRVNSLRVPFIKPKPADNPSSKSGRWAARVVTRPIRYGAVAAVLLGILAIPVFSMRLGFADAGNDGPSTTTRKAYDLLAQGYGAGVNGTLQVAVETHGAKDADVTLAAIGRALKAEPGIASVSPPTLNGAKDLALFNVTPTTSPQDDKTAQLLHRLRDDVLPKAVGDSKVQPLVTGGTALMEDASARLQQRMLWFLAAVIGLSFLVLTMVFRSILVPLKAAVLNLVSIGAAYGVVVAIFQWGWGANLIGVHATVPIMPLAPMLMFAILFGLSMDYEVFLVSQIRERYLHHGDPKRAIVEGVGSTGRVITSAALIMISVFGSFVLGSDVVAKMFGVGLAVAVLLDVTLVRMVLVPSVMSLLGHSAWWLPKWLERRLPIIATEGVGSAAGGDEVSGPELERVAVLV